MARQTSNTRQTSDKRKTNKVHGNVVENFNVENVRTFNSRFGDEWAFFDLDLGYIYIKGLLLGYTKDGKGYIAFQTDEHDGNYYRRGYINDDSFNDAIVEAVETLM